MLRIALLCLIASLLAPSLNACELCDAPGSAFVSLQSHFAAWPIVALGEPLAEAAKDRRAFRVTQVLQGRARVDGTLSMTGTWAVLPGKLWLLLGRPTQNDGTVDQSEAFEASKALMLRPATHPFLLALPTLPPPSKASVRLRALLPWLTDPEPMVAASVRKEFAAAPYEALAAAATEVAPAPLLRILAEPDASPASRGTLFLLVGLAGKGHERKRLAVWMRDPEIQEAKGFTSLLAAWLTLAGPGGIEPVRALLMGHEITRALIGSALVRALGFHARTTKVLTRERVLKEIRALLSHPEFFSASLDELIRLEAWSELPAVLAATAGHRERAPWTSKATLRYLQANPSPEARRERARLAARLAKPQGSAPDQGR